MPDAGTQLTEGYFPKIDRAHEQATAIYSVLIAFVKSDLYRPTGTFTKMDPNAEWHVITWTGLADPDPMWGVHIGEMVHNLRSALDHLAWNLVLVNGGEPTKDTVFPIYQSEREWIADLEQRRRRDDRPSPLHGISEAAFTIIKAAQPYHDGKRSADHSLMKLLRLSNIDKHRSLHIARLTAKRTSDLRIEPPGVFTIKKVRYPSPGSVMENGAELARVKLERKAVPETEMDMDEGTPRVIRVLVEGRTLVSVAFGEPGKQPIATLDDLGRMVITVRTLIGNLASLVIPGRTILYR